MRAGWPSLCEDSDDVSHDDDDSEFAKRLHDDQQEVASSESSDSSFLADADFASAVARAAELSGLTVVGTTVSDPKTPAIG